MPRKPKRMFTGGASPTQAALLVDEVATDQDLADHERVLFYPDFSTLSTDVGGQWWYPQGDFPTNHPNGVGFNTTVVDASALATGLNAYKIGSLYAPDHYLDTDVSPPAFSTVGAANFGAMWMDYWKFITDGTGEPFAATPILSAGDYRNGLYFRYCFMLESSFADGCTEVGVKMCSLKSGPLTDDNVMAMTFWAGKPGTLGAAAGKSRLHMYWQGIDVGIGLGSSDIYDLGVDLDMDTWYCPELYWYINDKGQSNGARTIWLNDVELYNTSGVQMHNYSGDNPVHIYAVHQQLYHGGADLSTPDNEMFCRHTAMALATSRIGMPVEMR